MVIACISINATIVRPNHSFLELSSLFYLAALFLTFLPIPLVLFTDRDGSQNVHIAPEAFTVASAEFADELLVWQNALPGPLRGQLSSVRIGTA